ncbi:McrB family protein [Thiomicrospira cyclica]|uniref:ATPase associated with various cellular activities AAA_5 n=1 Tax=Thiomicrospira cyclica (strain DSM 14477 / JCM 11371 / ALM1) TaxID=717773 RepID=F6DAI8_THICA|nr:AAA family ATPase [Thiomicrospira cyclica]AEG32244.1 ATPase associated with various cellular activities AAA_5 [Thiomicrospira cyclica ALM1]
MENYYFVGAVWNNTEDKTAEFVDGGYWEMGYDVDEKPKLAEQIKQIKVGERIAIKAATVQKNNLPFSGAPLGKSISKMTIKAIGTVVENPSNGQRVIVNWQKDFKPKDWYFFTYRATFWRINQENKWWSQYASKLVDFTFNDSPQDYEYFVTTWWNQTIEVESEDMSMQALDNQPLNTILYGPPGTGKTFNTVDLAWQILNVTDSTDTTRPGSIQELKSRYPGQVEFVTFHQSFSYEDFVEGIQAKTHDGKISYQVESGVFKRLAKLASKNLEDSQKSVNQLVEDLNLDKRYDDFITHAIESEVAFKKKKGTEFKIINTDDERLTIESPDSTFSGGEVQLKVEELKQVFQSDYPFQSAREVHEQIFSNKYKYTRQEDTYYLSLVNAFREFNESSEPTRQAEEVALKPHVLIIDEINRGNISRIFGELITLIEPSKRAGNDEAIEVTLPYSKEPFSVPNNLYIIGTMNTADRSLALMDTALRRRFDFMEMMPLPGLVTDNLEGVDVRKMLDVMNQRIEALYDREHTLGHAFLMNLDSLDDLRQAFKNKILPLLEECFYDDWQKIRWVLGAAEDHFYERQAYSNLFTDAEAPSDTEKFQRKPLDGLTAENLATIYTF